MSTDPVKEKIQSLCPDVMELKREEYFLDSIEVTTILKETLREAYNKRFNEHLNYDSWVGINDHLEECGRMLDKKISKRYSLNAESVGRDINLAVVLRAIGNIDARINLDRHEPILHIYASETMLTWNLLKDYDDQDEPTKALIGSLILN